MTVCFAVRGSRDGSVDYDPIINTFPRACPWIICHYHNWTPLLRVHPFHKNGPAISPTNKNKTATHWMIPLLFCSRFMLLFSFLRPWIKEDIFFLQRCFSKNLKMVSKSSRGSEIYSLIDHFLGFIPFLIKWIYLSQIDVVVRQREGFLLVIPLVKIGHHRDRFLHFFNGILIQSLRHIGMRKVILIIGMPGRQSNGPFKILFGFSE